MRVEKKYLVEEVATHLNKSNYVYLTNYTTITVDEIAELRTSLSQHNAEFHVVKNSILNVAAKDKAMPDFKEHLIGPTAIIVGGENPSGVAKVICKFFKDKEKVELKVGVLNNQTLSKDDIESLSKLPGLDVLRGQLLGLLSQPSTTFVRVVNAAPQNLLNVLQARIEKEKGSSV